MAEAVLTVQNNELLSLYFCLTLLPSAILGVLALETTEREPKWGWGSTARIKCACAFGARARDTREKRITELLQLAFQNINYCSSGRCVDVCVGAET